MNKKETTSYQLKRNPVAVNADELKIGDVVEVTKGKGRKDIEKLKVVNINADTFEVELEDGERYGVQKIENGQTIYVSKVEESKAPESKSVSTYQLKRKSDTIQKLMRDLDLLDSLETQFRRADAVDQIEKTTRIKGQIQDELYNLAGVKISPADTPEQKKVKIQKLKKKMDIWSREVLTHTEHMRNENFKKEKRDMKKREMFFIVMNILAFIIMILVAFYLIDIREPEPGTFLFIISFVFILINIAYIGMNMGKQINDKSTSVFNLYLKRKKLEHQLKIKELEEKLK